jgi:general secretion pathway protein E
MSAAPPPATAASRQPTVASGVPQPKQYTSADQLPRYTRVLTIADGRVPYPNAQAYGIVAIETGERKALVLITDEANRLHAHHVGEVQTRVRDLKYSIERGKTSQGVLRVIYESAGLKKGNGSGSGTDEKGLKAEFARIVELAVKIGASDIHIERREGIATIKMRRHGELVKIEGGGSGTQAEEMIRSVYMTVADAGSKSTTFQSDKFQAASIDVDITGTVYRLRFQSFPSFPSGSDYVMRLLPIGRKMKPKTLEELGYEPAQCAMLRLMSQKPTGIIFLAGTTGSGKSTTVSTLLLGRIAESPWLKGYTVEDPPENVLPGFTQIPVARKTKEEGSKDENPFLDAMKALVRGDPDIIFVGEVRDALSGRAVVSMVQSGHQIYSTVHTPSALGVPARLFDQGIEREVLGSNDFFSGLVYQRLVPVLCKKCRIPFHEALKNRFFEKDLIERLSDVPELEESDYDRLFARGGGCEACDGQGVVNRTVCAEVVVPDFYMYGLIRDGKDMELYKYWRNLKQKYPDAMVGWSALDHAILKMRRGEISPTDLENSFGPMNVQHLQEGREGRKSRPSAATRTSSAETAPLKGTPPEASP